MNEPPLHIVYVRPEIPQNTGSTARLCAATGIPLHLVGRLGFSTDEKAVRRAGLDYWRHVRVTEHKNIRELYEIAPGARFHYFSKTADKVYTDADYRRGDYLVFGSETRGLPEEILESNPADTYRIPILPCVRSLNLATATGIVVYEALRLMDFPLFDGFMQD